MTSRVTGPSGEDHSASLRNRLRERSRDVAALEGVEGDLLEAATQTTSCFRQGGKLLIFGNGGSAAQAQHLAAEFVGRLTRRRAALPAIALTTDGVMVTSLANDFGFASVFARQIEAIARQGDVAIVISTSGASANAIEGVVAARRLGLVNVGLIGKPHSRLHGLVDVPIVTPGRTSAHVQELQLIACHLLCEMVEDALFPHQVLDEEHVERRSPANPDLLRARGG
jgi:D-sedoheptulose 7-phosphate isomerase